MFLSFFLSIIRGRGGGGVYEFKSKIYFFFGGGEGRVSDFFTKNPNLRKKYSFFFFFFFFGGGGGGG